MDKMAIFQKPKIRIGTIPRGYILPVLAHPPCRHQEIHERNAKRTTLPTHPNFFDRHLVGPQNRLQGSGVTHATAAAGGSTIVSAIVGTLLRAVGAVVQLVLEPAACGAACAFEDAGIHVRRAGWADDLHAATLHVHLTADVDNTVGSEGVFTPRLRHLAVDEGGIRVESRPGARSARGEGNGTALARSYGDSDERLNGVDPGAGGAPDDENGVISGVVGEFVCERAIIAQPDAAVVRDGIGASRCEADGGQPGSDRGEIGVALLEGAASAISSDLVTVIRMCFRDLLNIIRGRRLPDVPMDMAVVASQSLAGGHGREGNGSNGAAHFVMIDLVIESDGFLTVLMRDSLQTQAVDELVLKEGR